jgi:hypothetical protein
MHKNSNVGEVLIINSNEKMWLGVDCTGNHDDIVEVKWDDDESYITWWW